MHKQIKTLSQKHPRYGYRRITALLRRAGHEVNSKRVQRARRMEGLQVSKKQRRMRRVGESTAAAAAGDASRSCVELGLRGGPDRARDALSRADLDR